MNEGTLTRTERVSVIIPAYNAEAYIKQCIGSVLSQDYKHYEIIAVDDGSTDGTGLVLDAFAREHSFIRVLHQENKGQSAARNLGLELAVGAYIIFLDADDYWTDNTLLRKCVEKMESGLNAVLFESQVRFEEGVKPGNNIYNRRIKDDSCVMTGPSYLRHMSTYHSFIVSPVLMMISRDYMERNALRFMEGCLYEDNGYVFELLMHAERVGFILEKMYMRRYNPGSTTQQGIHERHVAGILKQAEYILEIIRQTGLLSDRLFQRWLLVYLDIIVVRIAQCDYQEECRRTADEKAVLALGKRVGEQGYREVILGLHDAGCSLVTEEEYENAFAFKKKLAEEALRVIPFDKPGTVAVYGGGLHTERMLRFYRKHIGAVQATIRLIDQTLQGESISAVERIPELSPAAIVLSSFGYEQEMAETIEDLYGDRYPVYRFYHRHTFDLFKGL